MRTTHQVLTGIEVPIEVYRSSFWRDLRKSLSDAHEGDQVIIHLKEKDFPTDKLNAAKDAARNGAYGYAKAAELSKIGLKITTSAVNVGDVPPDVSTQLADNGITNPNDILVVCRKVRVS